MLYDVFKIICDILKTLFDSGFDILLITTVCFIFWCPFTILYKAYIDLGLPKRDVNSLNIIFKVIIINSVLYSLLLVILLVGTILFLSFFIPIYGVDKFIADFSLNPSQIKAKDIMYFCRLIHAFLAIIALKLMIDLYKLLKENLSIKNILKHYGSGSGALLFLALLYEGFFTFALIIIIFLDKLTPILFLLLFAISTYPIFLVKKWRQNIIKIILKFSGGFYRVDMEIKNIIDKDTHLKLNYKINNVIDDRGAFIFEFKSVLIFNCEYLNKIYIIDNIGFLSGSICLNQAPYKMHKKTPKYILDL